MNSEQGIAEPGQNAGRNHCRKRDKREHQVGDGQFHFSTSEHHNLPDGEYQQQWRVDEVDNNVGDEDDAEYNHHKCHEQEGCVDPHSSLDLPAVEPDEQRHENHQQQPRVVDGDANGHDNEIVVDERLGDSDEEREQEHTACDAYYRPLAFIVLIVPYFLGEAPSKYYNAQNRGYEDVEQDEHRCHEYHEATPLALDLSFFSVTGQRAVFL